MREFLSTLGIEADAPILLAGSTHAGEEKLVAEVFIKLRRIFPTLRFLVAPRHVERSAQVRMDLETLGLKVISRMEAFAIPANGRASLAPFDVLLLDTTGELRAWYSVATVVFIGKSLAAIGGQNPAEAIAAGQAVVFGPHMENFRDLVSRLLAADGALQIHDLSGLEAACLRLLGDPAERSRVAANGLQQLTAHRGAAARTADLLMTATKFSTCQSG